MLDKLLPASARTRVQAVAASRRTRRWGIGILVFIVLFGLLGFFAVPPLVHHQAEQQLSQLLSRPVSIGKVSLNPYTLKLEIDQLHIGERGGAGPFVDVRTLIVRASWGSMFRLKPVIGELYMDAPQIHVVRNDAQSFNFTDLVEQFSKPSPEPQPKPSKPLLFAVHNIHVDNGLIDFDDRLLKQHHVIDQFQFGIPFVANLPSKIDTFVQPFLQARIDGSLLQVSGETKPFKGSFDSDITVKLDQLDLSQLVSYAPAKLPVQLPSGKLSANLDVRFAMQDRQPKVQLSGALDLAQLSITDNAGQPLFDVAGIHVGAADLEPLGGIIHLSELGIDKPVLSVSRDRQGTLNFSKLAAAPAAKPAAAAAATAAAPPPPKDKPAPLDFSLQKLALNDGTVHILDQSTTPAASLSLQQITVTASNVSTLAHQPGQYEVHLVSDRGGTIASKGSLTLADSKLAADATIEQLALPVIQPYLAQFLAARLDHGNLGLSTSATLDWSATPAKIEVGPGVLSLDAVRLLSEKQSKPVVALSHAAAHFERIDATAHHAELPTVELEGLVLNAERGADGGINLTRLAKSAPPAKKPGARHGNEAAAAPWTYNIGAVGLSKSSLGFVDRSQAKPVELSLAPLQIKLQHISNDLAKPIDLDLSSGFQKKGQLKLKGALTPQPLKATLQLEGHQLDVAALEPYFAASLNASIASALLGLKGELKLAQEPQGLKVRYNGDAGLYRVRMLDKLTSDQFAGWRSFKVEQIKAAYGPQGTEVETGQITLSQFYGKVLLNANGRLNLSDITATQNAPATSLTRAQTGPAPAAAAPTPAPAPAPPPAPENAAAAAPLKLHFGHILMHQGSVDYTDNFIKPNFSANLINIEGDIGAIGTDVTTPAPIAIQATLNNNGPVSISGTANPLLKPPFLDLTATSRGVELTNFSAYSVKYAGYPILKGKLNVDLHYQVDQGQLKADNHIFIDQFTFGDHVDSPTATNLPVRLAISLLKNSRGEIDVDVPVSGSLNDPQISVGSLIWHAFLNVIEKAVTSPFSLLGAAFGGSDELGYVAFQPGSAVLSDTEAKKLETLVKALNDRPAIKLDLSGRVDPALDTPGLKQLALERAIKREKLKDVVGKGESVDVDNVQVAPDEYDKYLQRAYSDANIKNKPRNFIGIAKSQTPDQMKQLMLDATMVSEADLTALAQQRAAVVQQWFQGKIDPSRIFLVAPKMDAGGISDKGPSTRVEFKLKS